MIVHWRIDKRKLTFFLVLIIASFPDFINYRIAYLIYLFVFALNIKYIVGGAFEFSKNILPILLFFCWLYGVILGLLNGSGMDSLQNFFGLALILPTYLLLFRRRFALNEIISLVIYAGILQAVFQLVHIFNISDLDFVGFFIRESVSGLGDFRIKYNVGITFTIASFCLLTLLKEDIVNSGLFNFLIRYRFPICLFLLLAIFTSGSKGFFAAFAVTLIIRWLFYNFSKLRLFFVIALSVAIMLITSGTRFSEIVISSFSNQDSGNALREDQSSIIKKEWTVFGKGLGTPLLSGYQRATPYGLELTYHSIIHKFGYIVGGLLISSLFLLYFQSILRFIRKSLIGDAVGFSLLACLIPAYGNPSLFSPFSVMAICLAMYCVKMGDYFRLPSNTFND